jgi:hypothetical protein
MILNKVYFVDSEIESTVTPKLVGKGKKKKNRHRIRPRSLSTSLNKPTNH